MTKMEILKGVIKKAVLIIDQADRLSPDFLAGLADFARLSKAGRRLSHVILAARLSERGEQTAGK